MDSASDVQERNRQLLAAVQVRRDEFYEGILAFERAMAAPAGDDAAGWAAELTEAAQAMQRVLDDHIDETEGPGGFFEEIMEHFPNLARGINRLKGEHGPLVEQVGALVDRLQSVHDDDDVEAVRVLALETITQLLQHRHRGAELVYDAYNVDVATGD